MWEFDTELSEIIQRTTDVKSFRFQVSASNVTYQPGQFFYINIKIKDQDADHHFSFSSSPTEKGYIEFTKRITQHEFSQALAVMKPGSWAHLKGPAGSFVLPSQTTKLAFLSGGIGITALRSILKYIADTKQQWDIILLYSNKKYEEIVFRDELNSISAANSGIRIVHVLTEPSQNWKGKTGLISRDLIKETIPDYSERLFYTSGPPKMVTDLEEHLKALNVPESQLKHDSFTGYD